MINISSNLLIVADHGSASQVLDPGQQEALIRLRAQTVRHLRGQRRVSHLGEVWHGAGGAQDNCAGHPRDEHQR